QCNACAAVICRVFPKREFAIQLQIVNRNEVSVFVGNATGPLFKFLAVLFRPPVAQIALRIELAPLVVESMSQLMADDRANAPEIHVIVNFLVEERWLQNPRWENNLIAWRTVIDVPRRCSHAQFLASERLAALG